MRNQKPILILSPSTRGGSWRWIEEVVREIGVDKHCLTVAYGNRRELGRVIRPGFIVPFLRYEKFGLTMYRHPLLSLPFNLPLIALTYLALLRWRPRVIVTNGIVLALACMPYSAAFGAQTLMAFHGHVGHRPRWLMTGLRMGLRHVDRAFVNSVGSEADLRSLMAPDRICRVEHWADDVFFQGDRPRPMPHDRLKVLYVGRQDEEKVGFLLQVVEACAKDPIDFLFVGSGPYAARIAKLSSCGSVKHLGYLTDQGQLASIYREADVLWGVADDTYVAKPVAEALASGVPVIIPDVPAVSKKAAAGVRIPKTLVPSTVGWIIDGHDVSSARQLLLQLRSQPMDRGAACRSYATIAYSKRNLQPLIAAFADYTA